MDHDMMAHDHSGLHGDHGDHGDAHSCSHGHAMVFHAGVQQEILFRGWETTNALELFGSAVAIFLASVLYEGFKYYREALHANAVAPTDSQVNIAKNECGARGSCSGPAIVKYSMFSSAHFVQTCLHVIQSTVSYLLMLIFMTYNVWLCLALVLGLGLGYFCFGWKKSSVVDTNEHCQ